MYGLDDGAAKEEAGTSRRMGVQDHTVLLPQGQSRALSSFYVSFGGGMRIVGEDYMLAELSHMGLTRKGFRRLCKNLGVPVIYCKKGACVDFFAFVTALKTVTRPGNPDFAMPGSRARDVARARTERTGEVPRDEVVADLVGGRAMFGMATSTPQKNEISDATTRLSNTRRRLKTR